MLSEKQTIILNFLATNDRLTKADAMGLINTHYCNGAHHVGECLARMVKAGLLVRSGRGVYVRGTGKKSKPATPDVAQTTLF